MWQFGFGQPVVWRTFTYEARPSSNVGFHSRAFLGFRNLSHLVCYGYKTDTCLYVVWAIFACVCQTSICMYQTKFINFAWYMFLPTKIMHVPTKKCMRQTKMFQLHHCPVANHSFLLFWWCWWRWSKHKHHIAKFVIVVKLGVVSVSFHSSVFKHKYWNAFEIIFLCMQW